MASPTVATSAASSIGQQSVTLNGSISDTGGSDATRRGFQWNTVAAEDRDIYEDGTFGVAAFDEALTGLTPGQTYYFRAYATNPDGTSYGNWLSFTCLPNTYSVTINGTDRTADIINGTLVVEDAINDKVNTASFRLIDRQSLGVPETDQEIVITLPDGTILFGGYILRVGYSVTRKTGGVEVYISCVDYVRLLDRNLVHKTYEDMTDAQIIADIVSTYCQGFGITTSNVEEGATIDQISFNYVQPSQCLRKIADLTGRNWYIDYEKDIHYFPLETNAAPFDIDSSQNAYYDLSVSKDASQLKNRVYVRGGTKLSDATYYEVKGDGAAMKFPIPDKPHNVTLTVNGSPETVGIKNVDLTGYDWYLNFQEKYIEQDSGGTPLSTSDTLRIDYQYDIPILIALEDTSSIMASGVKEFAIFDKSITTTQAARDRAQAELTDYANTIIEGSFKTYTSGFRSGQYMTINLSSYGINESYIVQKVVARSFGAGNYEYQVYIASSKTMGIIRFLIELLEANKNLIELDDNEVIDELLQVTDSLLSDSITDNLTIDSAGPYATWCTDSLQSSPTTRAVWDLFQWG